MKTGIMGGTFNPIHNGHLILAGHVMEEFGLDEIWFMPNGIPPHKQPEETGCTVTDRLEMVRKAISGNSHFILQPYEIEKDTVSYSYETMEHFKFLFPDHDFYYIIGADSLFQLETWKHPERFLQTCTIIAAKRGKSETDQAMKEQICYLEKKYGIKMLYSHSPVFEVSSSEIREMVSSGQNIASLVPAEIKTYISRHHLYRRG